MDNFNIALLAKAAWKILTQLNTLLAHVMSAKYCDSVPFIQCIPKPSDTWVWKGILLGRDLILKGLGKLIGNGTTNNIWDDFWAGDKSDISASKF